MYRAIRLAFPLLFIAAALLRSQEPDPYADSPDWYKPGHPLNPAGSASIETLPGFEVEKLLDIPGDVGSLTSMTVDGGGDILAVTQHQPGIYRVTPSAVGSGAASEFRPLDGMARTLGWAQGILHAFDSVYVTVSEKNDVRNPGLYRLLDTDANGEYDEVIQLLEFNATGEHAAHNMVVSPDGETLYLICGNGTPVPESIRKRHTVRTTGFDHLMPDGFESSEYTDGGWVVRLNPDGGNAELIASGLRNSYDLAFNDQGDLFTADSDMEYDLGTPWYRPTRVCQIVSGGEFGWRPGAAKWPEYHEDSLQPVVNIGPGSPTGVLFGYEAAFPSKYRNAFYVLDWTFATLYAVHLQAEGAGYTATFEKFASGVGLPLTDCVIGQDGALYFSVGGRRLGSAIYRIWYSGPDLEVSSPIREDLTFNDSRDLRLALEYYHGRENPKVVALVWPHLGSEDRAIRYAARLALESQPLSEWRNRALDEAHPQTKFPALLALARQGNSADLLGVLDQLATVDYSVLSEEGLLLVLRIYERILGRGETAHKEEAAEAIGALRPLLPHSSRRVNRELARILCYLREPSVIEPLLELMERDTGERNLAGAELVSRNLRYGSRLLDMMEAAPMVERMHHAQMLLWIKDGWSLSQRKRFFQLMVDAMNTSKGGKGYAVFWKQILDIARQALTEAEMGVLSPVWESVDKVQPLPMPDGPGRIWEMAYLLDRLEQRVGKRDYDNGKKMYAAASCITCHVMGGEGGITGPDLTSIGQRFTIRDLLDAINHPSKTISDQYQLMTVTLENGESLSGRIHARDSEKISIASNVLKPTQTQSIRNSEIDRITPLPVSTMPPGLLNTLNEEEVLNLLAYLVAGGDPDHEVFRQNKRQ